jgi:molecular chaperone GrpE
MARSDDEPTNGQPAQGPGGHRPSEPGGPPGSDPAAPVDPAQALDDLMRDPAGAGDAGADQIDEELGQMLAGGDSQALAAERDEFRDALQRLKAEFDNYRKRTAKADAETRERASESLVVELLPVLDACDAAVVHDAPDVGPISKMLLETLQKQGLEAMVVEGQVFDPLMHEAVLHEPGEGGESVVTESLRTGYLWKGRVLRPAMVKVKG